MLNAVYVCGAVLILVAIYDVVQTKHAILRNFPILGHFRYLLETIGPELRQYIVTSNNEERPFSRDERTWVYASSKKQNNYFGFGTDNDLEQSPNHLIIKHSAFPLSELRPGQPGYDPKFRIPCGKILGEARNRKHAFRPASVVNVSGMSYGSMSGPAVEAINRGCGIAECLHNTGEGGISEFHQHGGELIWQIGTGYFGCRDQHGQFDLQRFKENVARNKVKAIEIKLSQGAKPGLGGLLPAAKITPEIAKIRGIPMGKDCASPSAHSAFHDVDSMLDFVEMLADESGLPVGIKSAVGESQFWSDLARIMDTTGRGVDFITVDGGEGGTGAAPLVFSDHVALPFKLGFTRVYREFFARGIHSQVVFVGSGKLGFPASAILAFALGCDMVHVAREPMLSIGCIQAQRCHTGHCPTGVATQSRWLMRGLDPTHKGARLANYIVTLRKEILQLSRVCGVMHPSLVTADQCEITDERFGSMTARELFKLADSPDYGLPSDEQRKTMLELPKSAS
jgi:glutamate synthase domain-containing protein 2